MKTKTTLSIITAISMMMACENIPEPVQPESANLQLSTKLNHMTKSLQTGTYLTSNSTLGVTVVDENGNDYESKNLFNLPFTTDGEGENQEWIVERNVTLSNTDATIYTYFPYSVDVTDITAVPIKIESQNDVMWGTPVSEINASNPIANVSLNHALSAIRLNISKNSYEGAGVINSIRIASDAFANAATMNAKTGAIRVTDTNIGVYSCEYQDKKLTEEGNNFTIDYVVIPNAITSHISIILEIDGQIFKTNSAEVTLQQGNIMAFDLKINKNTSEIVKATIIPWNETPMGELSSVLNPTEDMIEAVYNLYYTGKTTILYGTYTSNIARMFIDNIEVAPVTSYDFKTKGKHTVHIQLKDKTTLCSFRDCNRLTNIKLPNYIEKIPDYCFHSTPITSIYLPKNISSIGSESFKNTSQLESITIDSLNPTYNDGNGSNCIIETATNKLIVGCSTTVIPNTVTTIGKSAFYKTNITTITIPESVTTIEDYAFSQNLNLQKIAISKNICSFTPYIFSECKNIESITIDSLNPTYNDGNGSNCIIETATNKLVFGCSTTVIPNTVTTIGKSAFYGTNITAITIPESITTIEKQAFYSETIDFINILNPNAPTIEESVFYKLVFIEIPSGSTNYDTWRNTYPSKIMTRYHGASPKIKHIDGTLYTADEWTTALTASTVTNEQALGIAIPDPRTENNYLCLIHPTYQLSLSSRWADNNTAYILIEGVTTTINAPLLDFNGKANTEAILAAKQSNASITANFIAEKCAEVVFANGQTGYLPAAGEIAAIYAYKDEVIACMNACGKVSDLFNYEQSSILSSTQYDDDEIWEYYSTKISKMSKTSRSSNYYTGSYVVCPFN